MSVAYYKFCYWAGVKLHIRKLEMRAYLRWFSELAYGCVRNYFAWSEDYFRFCERWNIRRKETAQ